MDPNLIALGITVLANVLFLGFIYGKVVTRLDALSSELRGYVRRTDRTIDEHGRQLGDHAQRIARLEATRNLPVPGGV